MADESDLICAFIFDGKGGGKAMDWPDIRAWRPEDGPLWVHLDFKGANARRWLAEESGIDEVTQSALLESVVRPRVMHENGRLFVSLRAINLNPGADATDMVSLRMLASAQRIVTLRHRRLMAVSDLRDAVARGTGPKNAGEFLAAIAVGIADRIAPVVDEIDDRIDGLEEEVLTAHSTHLRSLIGDVRRDAIALRRYLAPQRDVMGRLAMEQADWLSMPQRALIREVADRTTRFVEDLDSGRERAQVVQDELNNRVADQMNRTMYLLTVVAAILLPPSLLTGLLGINVGGMPGVDSGWAFAIVALAIPVVAVTEFVVLRKLKWI